MLQDTSAVLKAGGPVFRKFFGENQFELDVKEMN